MKNKKLRAHILADFFKSIVFSIIFTIVADPFHRPTNSGSFRITLPAGDPLLYELLLF